MHSDVTERNDDKNRITVQECTSPTGNVKQERNAT